MACYNPNRLILSIRHAHQTMNIIMAACGTWTVSLCYVSITEVSSLCHRDTLACHTMVSTYIHVHVYSLKHTFQTMNTITAACGHMFAVDWESK